jgi:hypothetical protein
MEISGPEPGINDDVGIFIEGGWGRKRATQTGFFGTDRGGWGW